MGGRNENHRPFGNQGPIIENLCVSLKKKELLSCAMDDLTQVYFSEGV
jgi:hypothetical protein